jgi:hypothetical protein
MSEICVHEKCRTWRSYHKSGVELDRIEQSLNGKEIKVNKDAYAKIGVSREFTKNLGNYQSVKGGVYIEIPCLPETDHIEKTYEEAATFASNMAAIELKDAEEWVVEVGLSE